MNEEFARITSNMRSYFDSGATLPKEFRLSQLRKLKKSIVDNEQKIYDALHTDLGKPMEEAWVTEIGFVMAEIRHALSGLSKWMRPEKVSTNLLNFPSKSYIYKEPLGVVLIIGPWNYPFQLLMAPLVGAIAAGNAVILKPSELAPATSALIANIIRENFDPAFIACIEGDGAEVVPALMNAVRFDHVFYTGSTSVGKKIYQLAAEKLVPVTLELGGKSPCIVEEDANIKVAAKRIALTKWSNAGQMCVAPDYVLVHERIHMPFIDELGKAMAEFYGPSKNKDGFGKIINKKAVDRLTAYLDQGQLAYGGIVDGKLGPTIIGHLPVDAAIMKEEIFGPILPVIPFKSFEEAKAIVANYPDPLAFYVFTGSRQKEEKWINEVSFGGGCVNNAAWHLTNPNLPFGGRGNSGIGAYHGKFSFDVFTHRKSVMKTPTWLDPSIRYPPFAGKLNLFKKLIR